MNKSKITNQKSETKTETKSWILDGFCFFKSLILFFSQESAADCCLSSLEYNIPQALIPFIVCVSTAPGAKTHRKSF